MTRKMATVRVISDLRPIPDADAIETAVIDGWTVVVKKGEFQVGQKVIYLEIDSFVPHDLAPFLSKGKEPREYNGVKGEKLKTVKLRKQLSQGLVLPLEDKSLEEGTDLSELLGIQKWEAPIHPSLRGVAKGTFPTNFFSKSDQERAQNIIRSIFENYKDDYYEVSLKLDGSSISVFNINGEVGVASRNLWLKESETNADNTFIKTAKESGLFYAMKNYPDMLFQGELMGPGIQGNREEFDEHRIYIYNIQRTGHEFLSPGERYVFFNDLVQYVDSKLLQHVPILHYNIKLSELGINNIEDLKKFSDRASIKHSIAEGLVFKSNNHDFQFKIINDKFLLKGGE